MQKERIREKAAAIRDVIRYIHRFQNALVVIYLDDTVLDSTVFLSHIKDIAMLHQAGLRVVLIPGSARRIDEILSREGMKWQIKDGCRITGQDAMPLIKMASFDVSNQVMTALAGVKISALIGNWVRARGRGVLDGFDWGTVGDIDRIDSPAIDKVLDAGFIPIFPCIGWSIAGKPYNISSLRLAEAVAVHLHADKLFFLVPGAEITAEHFIIPHNIGISEEGKVPALDLQELDAFISANKDYGSADREKLLDLLGLAGKACESGVTRAHILDGAMAGTLPCEIFSDLGSGTMVYTSNYGKIRDMTHDDIPAVLSLMQPFVERGILLPRTKQMLDEQYTAFIVYELDGAIRACASLVPYSDGQMEIAALAVDASCSHLGIGPKLMSFLKNRARERKAKGVFLLTTQTADWFENLGFVPSDISTLPQQRRAIWTPGRGSKVLRMEL